MVQRNINVLCKISKKIYKIINRICVEKYLWLKKLYIFRVENEPALDGSVTSNKALKLTDPSVMLLLFSLAKARLRPAA